MDGIWWPDWAVICGERNALPPEQREKLTLPDVTDQPPEGGRDVSEEPSPQGLPSSVNPVRLACD